MSGHLGLVVHYMTKLVFDWYSDSKSEKRFCFRKHHSEGSYRELCTDAAG
jgi:hypothetical protein